MEVREICERYGIPYNTGPLHRQFGSVVRKIRKLSFPPLRGLGRSAPLLDEQPVSSDARKRLAPAV